MEIRSHKYQWFTKYLTWPFLFWLTLWASINSGPWALTKDPVTKLDWLHFLRTIAPFLTLFIVANISLMNKSRKNSSSPLSVKLWLLYCLIGLLSTILSPEPWYSFYWAMCFFIVIAGVQFTLSSITPLRDAIRLNYLTWTINTVFLVTMILIARDVLIVSTTTGLTGYGLVGRMPDVMDMAMSRSSGISRFAAVPGIVAFAFLWHGPMIRKMLWAVVFILSSSLIYFMQSRGAIFAYGFAVSFILLFQGRTFRNFGAVLLIIFGFLLFTDLSSNQHFNHIAQHIFRGQSTEEFLNMSGRTRAWENAWEWIWGSPFFGWGFQADRFLIYEHVHNTYLYTLLTAGFLGTAAFAGGLALTWFQFFRVLRKKIGDAVLRIHLIQCAGILAFFTMRSIPEVSGAMFSVDLMVMLPAMTFISLMERQAYSEKRSGKLKRLFPWSSHTALIN